MLQNLDLYLTWVYMDFVSDSHLTHLTCSFLFQIAGPNSLQVAEAELGQTQTTNQDEIDQLKQELLSLKDQVWSRNQLLELVYVLQLNCIYISCLALTFFLLHTDVCLAEFKKGFAD